MTRARRSAANGPRSHATDMTRLPLMRSEFARVSVVVDEPPGNEGLKRASLKLGFVERRVLRFRAKLVGLDGPGRIEVNQNDVGRGALRPPTRGKAKQPGWIGGQRAEQRGEIDVLVVIEAKRCAEQRLKADGAIGGVDEEAPFHIGILRIVSRDDHVDITTGETLDHGAAVVL